MILIKMETQFISLNLAIKVHLTKVCNLLKGSEEYRTRNGHNYNSNSIRDI
jgi:hypothetical protein